jgi:hypothetical protein
MKIYRIFKISEVTCFVQKGGCSVKLVGQNKPSIIFDGYVTYCVPAISNIDCRTAIELNFESSKDKKLYRKFHPMNFLKFKKIGDKKVVFYSDIEMFYFEIELTDKEYKIFEKIPEDYFFGFYYDFKWGIKDEQ